MRTRVLIDGSCRARALVLEEPLSYLGGVRPRSGEIVDRHHPQAGASVAGRVLVLPGTRGSSGGPGALAEAFRLGAAPAAFLLPAANLTIVTAVLVADALYQRSAPVLVLPPGAEADFHTGDLVSITPGGRITRTPAEEEDGAPIPA